MFVESEITAQKRPRTTLRSIGGYTIMDKFAEGSYGTVHRCEKNGEFFACKIISKRRLAVDVGEGHMDMPNEIAALKVLDDPNIIKMVHVEETAEEVFVIMEMMCGGELVDHILQRERLSETEASSVVQQVASGLNACHKQNMLHRDLKPANLLLARKGGIEEGVKIADFGYATILPRGGSAKRVLGSPGYLAPEMHEGRAYGTAVDIWSLGVIMYVMLFGYMPFDCGQELDPSLDLKSYYTLDFVTEDRWRTVSPSARELLEKMLHYDQTKRPTAAEICNDTWIQEWLDLGDGGEGMAHRTGTG
jgi:serine/threonine protein kinase